MAKRTGYQKFVQAHQAQFCTNHSVRYPQVLTLISAHWKALSAAQQQPYIDAARNNRTIAAGTAIPQPPPAAGPAGTVPPAAVPPGPGPPAAGPPAAPPAAQPQVIAAISPEAVNAIADAVQQGVDQVLPELTAQTKIQRDIFGLLEQALQQQGEVSETQFQAVQAQAREISAQNALLNVVQNAVRQGQGLATGPRHGQQQEKDPNHAASPEHPFVDLNRPFVPREAPHRAQEHHENAVIGQVIQDEDGLRGEWVGKAILGSGGFGRVSLWLRYDKHGTIVDRVAIKDVDINSHAWLSPLTWHDEVNLGKTVPMEVAIHRRLHERNCRFVVGFRNASAVSQRRFRIYQEYAPHGTFGTLATDYRNEEERLPDQFLWYAFKALVEACLVMHQGAVADEEAVEQWNPIVHRDLKPLNVLLGERNLEGAWLIYPTPQLCDFGLAIQTNDDFVNPEDYIGPGTKGFQAPEQKAFLPYRPFQGTWDQLGAHTNVWGIGAIMHNLLNPTAVYPGMVVNKKRLVLHVGGNAEDVSHIEGLDDQAPYPGLLKELLRQCLEFEPSARPSLRDLHDQIEAYIDRHEVEPERWMPSGSPSGSLPSDIGGKLLLYKDDADGKGAFLPAGFTRFRAARSVTPE